MAPKSKKDLEERDVDEPTGKALEETKRLTALAYDQGILSKAKTLNAKTLKPNKVLLSADGKDINKKSNVRKGRYLLNINAQLAAATAGKLGSLAQLDTRNPVLYVDFPDGRLKFLGTIVFPNNKYMVLKIGTKDILCEDVLESMVVFSEAIWIGKKEENPDERAMPMPLTLRASEEDIKNVAWAGHEAAGPEVDLAGDSDSEEVVPSQSQRATARTAGRRRAAKRPRYNESGSEPESEDEEDLEEEEDAGAGAPSLDASDNDKPVKPARKRQAVHVLSSPPSQPEQEMELDAAAGPSKPAKAGKTKQGTLAAFLKPTTNGAAAADPSKAKVKQPSARPRKPAKKEVATSDEDDGEDAAGSLNEDDGSDVDIVSADDEPSSPAAKRPKPMKKPPPKKKPPSTGPKKKPASKKAAVDSDDDEDVIVLGSEDDAPKSQATPRRAARASAQKAKAKLVDLSDSGEDEDSEEDEAPDSDESDYAGSD